MKYCSIFQYIFCGTALLFLCGCMSFEYTGREFAPLKQGRMPVFYKNRKLLPEGKYIIIGRAVITTSPRTEYEDIQDKFLEEAALRGADAVCIASDKIIYRGIYETGDDMAPTDRLINPYNLTPDGAPIQVSLNGRDASLPAESRGAPQLIVNALFLKDKAAVEKTLLQRKKQLDAMIGTPAVPGNKQN